MNHNPFPLRLGLLFAAALTVAACSTDTTLEDEHRVDLRQPMVFGHSAAQQQTEVTRADAGKLEESHNTFKVSTWKAFGLPGQQTVMDQYRVDYTATAKTDYADSYNWYYEGVNNQPLRYWDLSAFPYEFHAIAPYDNNTVLTTNSININCADDNYFLSQTRTDDTNSTGNEPYVVAHVTRTLQADGSYADNDVIKNLRINTAGEANATREVHMPFHHLMSKVGFRVFIDNPAPEQKPYHVILESVKISIVRKDKNNEGSYLPFITASKKYTASNALGYERGVFEENTEVATSADNPYVLLSHGQYYEPAGSTTLLDLHQHLHRQNAYNLTPGELLQIPQAEPSRSLLYQRICYRMPLFVVQTARNVLL